MKGRPRTFGEDVRHFAQSLDILDQNLCNRATDVILQYLKRHLEIAYFEMVAEQVVDERRGIKTVYCNRDDEHSSTLTDLDGQYTRQLCVSFAEGVPIWVVNPEKQPLSSSDGYVDLWSGRKDLPVYTSPDRLDGQIRTSILVPGKMRGRVVVALDIEATNYLEITEDAKRELETLAEAFAHLRDCCDFNRSRTTGTESALSTLREIAEGGPKFQLTKPSVFVAFSSRADDQVTNVIDDVLREFRDKLTIEMWSDIHRSGNVTVQIAEAVERARFGICYFSEPPGPGADDAPSFQDNHNVVFEAGMLHALTNSPGKAPSGWIPIREKDSPPPPFDFAQQRIEEVPRKEDGRLDEVRFRDGLRSASMTCCWPRRSATGGHARLL